MRMGGKIRLTSGCRRRHDNFNINLYKIPEKRDICVLSNVAVMLIRSKTKIPSLPFPECTLNFLKQIFIGKLLVQALYRM